jgi:hypothetical protein
VGHFWRAVVGQFWRAVKLAAGLDVRYTGWNCAPVDAKPEALRSLLAAIGPALGFTLDHVDHALSALAALARAKWAERVAPVLVGRQRRGRYIRDAGNGHRS